MRWRDLHSWEAMIDLATRIHDDRYFGYGSVSPPMPMTGCSRPEPECVALHIAHYIGPGWQCTKPGYVPRSSVDTGDCPQRILNIAQAPRVQTSPEQRTPPVRFGTSEQMVVWMRDALARLQEHPDLDIQYAAMVYLDDLDASLEWEALMNLGEELLKLCDQEKPWTWKV